MRHGSRLDPPNRFVSSHAEHDDEHLEWDDEYRHQRDNRRVEYLPDASRSIVASNDSPDIPFNYSVNPYRGCAHGCPYCYARNTHEYLGLNAGLDFETKIFVKHEAAALLSEFLSHPSWRPEPICFSGVTDCYQPCERKYRLTRQCLELALACRQPVTIITKNALVVRDLDILREMARLRLIRVAISITTLDKELARNMEPMASAPSARLRAIAELSAAGVPTLVMAAPLIPGLNDDDMPEVLKEARRAGAGDAGMILLRLPLTVLPVFEEWLRREHPGKAERVLGRVRQTRDGQLNDATFGVRMVGTGPIAEQIRQLFGVCRRKHGFATLPPLDVSLFRPPPSRHGQQWLF